MDYKKKQKRTKIIIFLLRWWAVGAVYFFIGWGTNLGKYTSMIDFVIMLGIVIGVFQSFIVFPVLRQMFGYGRRKRMLETTTMERVSDNLLQVVLSIGTVYLVTLVYTMINSLAILIFGLSDTQVFLPGEPILFGLFYVLIAYFFKSFYESIKLRGKAA
jgi:hypothetical protein